MEKSEVYLAALMIILLASMSWGWAIMIVSGSLGWNISFWQSCGLGFLVSSFIVSLKADGESV